MRVQATLLSHYQQGGNRIRIWLWFSEFRLNHTQGNTSMGWWFNITADQLSL